MPRPRWVAALGLALAAPALAYMLPAWSLIRKTELKREEAGLRSLRVTGTLTLIGPAAESLSHTLNMTPGQSGLAVPMVIGYHMPGRCRAEVQVGPGKELLTVQVRDGKATASPGLEPVANLLRLSCPILSAPGGEESTHAVVEWMKALGVDFQVTNLSRFGGTIAEVVGAEARDLSHPQVWIDENELNPLRVIGSVDKVMLDAHLLDPGPVGGDWHPRALELWTLPAGQAPAQMQARFTVEKAEPNAKLPES